VRVSIKALTVPREPCRSWVPKQHSGCLGALRRCDREPVFFPNFHSNEAPRAADCVFEPTRPTPEPNVFVGPRSPTVSRSASGLCGASCQQTCMCHSERPSYKW
jgi:hypothetical protein